MSGGGGLVLWLDTDTYGCEKFRMRVGFVWDHGRQ